MWYKPKEKNERQDNIMKKVKRGLMKHLVSEYNINLSKIPGYETFKILNLPGNFNENLKKSENLKYLYRPMKTLLSINKMNETNINIILGKKENKKKIEYIFNLTFKECLDFVRGKKKPIYEEIKFDGFNEIKDDKDEDKHYDSYSYVLNNYEKLFSNRKERNSKKK